MDLKTYLKTMPVREREAFAKRCGTSLKHLNNIAYCSDKPCSPELAIEIERESSGRVRVEELTDKADWAYIRGTAKFEAA
jgi:DNA-binding transcriptional regulator YdaS (Cro superfamily)